MKKSAIEIPSELLHSSPDVAPLLLHACCAPCSSAIVEWLVANGVRPTIFYYNPNIWPREEYEIRKRESKRHAESLGIRWIDGDYVHEEWRQGVCFRGTRNEEGGTRILLPQIFPSEVTSLLVPRSSFLEISSSNSL